MHLNVYQITKLLNTEDMFFQIQLQPRVAQPFLESWQILS
jgi:hypothetical protein